MGKRTLSVSMRIAEEDMALLMRAAQKLWPRAVMNRSAVMLSLAKMAAEDALKKK